MPSDDDRILPDPAQPAQRRSNDNYPTRQNVHLVDDLVMGLRFFSRLPVGDRPHEIPNLDRIARGLPFTSALIGIGPAVLLVLLCLMGVPAYFAAALAVTAMVLLTGAMTEDALADSADGLFGGPTPERRLEIFKDSRHGTYGVVAIALLLILRVTALGGIALVNPLAAGSIWLGAMVVSRSASLYLPLALPPARAGLAASVGQVSPHAFVIGSVFALIIGFVTVAPFARIVGFALGTLLAALVIWGWSALCKRLVGGQTGDLIGAAQGLAEIAALTGFLIFA